MLLSMFISFFFATVFRRRTYVYASFMATALTLIVFFSVGVPGYYSWDNGTEIVASGIIFDTPVPLSFPFYTSLNRVGQIGWAVQYYRFHLFTLMYYQTAVGSSIVGTQYLFISWGDYVLFFSFFLLVNIIGAAIAYWINRRPLVTKLLRW